VCLLDQAERQKIAEIKAQELIIDLKDLSDNNSYVNRSSITYYNILAAATVDIVRDAFKISDVWDITINEEVPILYSKAAAQEYGGGTISIDNITAQLSNSGKTLGFPKVIDFVSREIPSKVSSREVKVREINTIVLSDIIKSTSFYNYMVSDVKEQFDIQFESFLKRWKNNSFPVEKEKGVVIGSPNPVQDLEITSSKDSIDFNILTFDCGCNEDNLNLYEKINILLVSIFK
jgi:hypothetical protein